MTVLRPVDVVVDPSSWRDADAAMVAEGIDRPSWRLAAFQRLAAIAWTQADLRGPAEPHWAGVLAGREWLLMPGDEVVLRERLGDDVVAECWRAALASVGGATAIVRPQPADDRRVIEAARRHLQVVAQKAGVAPPRVVRVYVGDDHARVAASGVPGGFAALTVPAGARIRATGIDMPDGTRRVVGYDARSGGFDRTHWSAT